MKRYAAYGLEIESEIALPLPPSTDRESTDLRVRLGGFEAPARGTALPYDAGGASYGPFDGGTLVRVPGAGAFLVSASSIRVAGEEGAAMELLGRLVAMVALGFSLQARSVLAFHGAAVAKGGEAIAILGDRGAGKSTTVAGLCARGWGLLCDDVVAVAPDGFVAPGSIIVRLTPDSAERLAKAAGAAGAVGARRDPDGKLPLPVAGGARARLSAIFELTATDRVAASPVRGYAKLRRALRHLHSPAGIGDARDRMLAASTALSRIPLYAIERPVHRFALEEILDLVEARARKESP